MVGDSEAAEIELNVEREESDDCPPFRHGYRGGRRGETGVGTGMNDSRPRGTPESGQACRHGTRPSRAQVHGEDKAVTGRRSDNWKRHKATGMMVFMTKSKQPGK